MKKLILASASPRRRELLSMLDINFTIAEPYHVNEIFPKDMHSRSVAQYLSELKSKAYPKPILDDEILLTADTVVILNDRIIGKPTDKENAKEILSTLSDNTHTVTTGVTLRGPDFIRSFTVSSDVYFRALESKQIEYYVETYRPMDKAGAYGVQEWIGLVAIERIEGSFYNVMGLPTSRLMTELTICRYFDN